MPVTFPTTPLTCTVQIALGADLTANPSTWTWTDITQYVRFAQGISQTVGRPDESSVVNPSKGTLTLDNTDGRFTRRNPLGAYYGQLGYNTPIKATIDPGTGAVTRMAMFVNEWPTRWDRSSRDATVPIVCAGKLRQLTQGKQRVRSPLRRTIEAAKPSLYWPLEDGSSATSLASDIAGGSVLIPSNLGSSSLTPAGSASAINFAPGATAAGNTGLPVSSVASWEATMVVGFDTFPSGSPSGNDYAFAQFNVGGTSCPFFGFGVVNNVHGTDPTAYQIAATNMDDPSIGSAYEFRPDLTANLQLGHTYHIRMVLTQSGSNIALNLYVDGTLRVTNAFHGTLFQPVSVQFNSSVFDGTSTIPAANPSSVSHLAFWIPSQSSDSTYLAANGYAGEGATTRLYRVAAEAGILMAGSAGNSVAMGPQPVGTDLDVLRDCEKVDGGAIIETNWGLGYNGAGFYYDNGVALSLDFAAGHIAEEPKPADDDQRLRNKWSVGRTGASEATVALVSGPTSGPLYTDPGGPGVYEDDLTSLNVATDGQLPHEASWRVHIGTVDEDRWPSMKLRLHGTPALISSWVAMALGDRYQAVNVPSQGAGYPVDEILEGFTERWDPLSWDVDMFGSPSVTWEVFEIQSGSGNRSRIAAGVSTTAASYGPGVTSLSVVSAAVPWIDSATYGSQFPIVIVIAGEVMTCTNIAGTGLTQTFTVTRALYGTAKTLPSGSQVQLFRPAAIAK